MTKLSLDYIVERTQGELLRILPLSLAELGYTQLAICQDYVYAQGSDPIMLQAHIDTAMGRPYGVFESRNKNVLWSPSGIGGDDRCGVYAILAILKRTAKRPSILFTNHEESGGAGSTKFLKDFKDKPKANFVLAFDREGDSQAVYYRCGNAVFVDMITSFGFRKEEGTFSDISILAPAWDIAAVNLSVGYHHQHSMNEFIVVSELNNTIVKATRLIEADNKISYDFQKDKKAWGRYTVMGNYNGASGVWVNGKWVESYYDDGYDEDYLWNKKTGRWEKKKDEIITTSVNTPLPLSKKVHIVELNGKKYWDFKGKRYLYNPSTTQYDYLCDLVGANKVVGATVTTDLATTSAHDTEKEEYERLFGSRTLLPKGEFLRDEDEPSEEELQEIENAKDQDWLDTNKE